MLFVTLCVLLAGEIVPGIVGGSYSPNITSLGYRRNCCDETDVFTTTIQESGSMGHTTRTLEIPEKGRDWNVTLTRVIVTDLNDNHHADVHVLAGGINKGFIRLKFTSPSLRGLTLHIIAFGYDSKYAYRDYEKQRREGGSAKQGYYSYHHQY